MKAQVSFEVEVEPDWIDLCTKHNDLFMTSYCGYWMRGMEQDDKLGWLCYEFDYSSTATSIRDMEDSPEYQSIVEAWRNGEKLPDHWYRLDEAAAIKAWVEGVKKFGTDWYEEADSTYYDIVIQMALLGSVVYG